MAIGIQPGQTVHETQSQKNPLQKRASGVAQGIGPKFKVQTPVLPKTKQTNKKKKTGWSGCTWQRTYLACV
jgi:hypothetical protein